MKEQQRTARDITLRLRHVAVKVWRGMPEAEAIRSSGLQESVYRNWRAHMAQTRGQVRAREQVRADARD